MASLQLLSPHVRSRPMPLSAAIEAPLVYQPYFSEEQRAQLSPDCAQLDGRFNVATNSREYELFQHLMDRHLRERLSSERFWGLVSSKFDQKSPVPIGTFLSAAQAAQDNGYDAYVLNPMIGNAAIFIDVWEQGVLCGHRGLDQICALLTARGYPSNILQVQEFAFCNYFCGNLRFWTSYFNFMSNVLDLFEAEARARTPVGLIYAGSAGYRRDPTATMRPFIVERLLSCFLTIAVRSDALKIACYQPTDRDFNYKFGPRIASALVPLYRLKAEAVERADEAMAKAWLMQRSAIVKNNPAPVWELDDPPAWIPRGI